MNPFDTTRLYLSRVMPWPPTGDPDNFINIMWTHQGEGYDRPTWRGTPCLSIDECIGSIARAVRNPHVKAVYACMSSQRECEVRQGAYGPFKIAIRSQQNAHQLRALYADIDVKKGGYPDTAAALAALKEFLAKSGLQRPNVLVASGSGGFHAYWTLDRALSVPEWQPLANALAEALRRHGVKADTACTVDAARVLRVPETWNTKTDPPSQVTLAVSSVLPYDYSLDQIRAMLAPYMGAQIIPLTPRGKLEGPNATLAAGIDAPQAPPVALQSVADAGCGFIRDAVTSGGASYNNPLWNLTTLTAVFTEGGREDAHLMAKGHPTYTVEETDLLFDRKVKEKEAKNLGWPSCQTIENSGCVHCNNCPIKGPNTRPLQFGRPSPTPNAPLSLPAGASAVNILPYKYSRNPDGYIMRLAKGKDPGTVIHVQASPFPIRDAWVQEDPWTLHCRVENVADGYRQISITTRDANSGERFRAVMGERGIPLGDEMAKEFREFIVAWQTMLQRTKDAVMAAHPYGWVESNGQIEGFAFDGQVWMPNGKQRAAGVGDDEVHRQYTVQGDLQVWKDAVKIVTDLHSPGHDAMLAAAFAGPLVRFTGLEGLLISAYSSASGCGKTSIMKMAQAVWSRPTIALNGLTDTNKSVFGKAVTLKNLPLFWDEIKSEQDRTRFIEIAFQLSAGTDTARMKADTSLRRRGEWKTLVMSACNDSILDLVARQVKSTTAGVHRVFEFALDRPIYTLSGAQADQHVLAVQSHYGGAGLEYAKWLGEHHDAIARDVLHVREQLEKNLIARSDERFWICSIVCLFLGAKYANKVGLTEFDCEALLRFLLNQFKNLRKRVDSSGVDMARPFSIVNILSSYFTDMRAKHTLTTNIIYSKRGKPSPNAVKVLLDTTKLEAIHVQKGLEEDRVRFSQRSFREWLEKHGFSISAVEAVLENSLDMKRTFAGMGAGTMASTGQMHCYEMKLSVAEKGTIEKAGEN